MCFYLGIVYYDLSCALILELFITIYGCCVRLFCNLFLGAFVMAVGVLQLRCLRCCVFCGCCCCVVVNEAGFCFFGFCLFGDVAVGFVEFCVRRNLPRRLAKLAFRLCCVWVPAWAESQHLACGYAVCGEFIFWWWRDLFFLLRY